MKSFHAFYNAMLAANIGKFDSVNIALRESDLESADAINESISDENNIEANNKIINNLIINKISVGDTLNSSDTTALEEIFTQHWDTAGLAVYSAAAILFKEYYTEVEEVSPRLAQQPQQKPPAKEAGSIKLFPNPANSKLYITGLTGEKNTIEVYDCYGRLVYKKPNAEETSEIDISFLANGLYSFRVLNSTGICFKTTFALLK